MFDKKDIITKTVKGFYFTVFTIAVKFGFGLLTQIILVRILFPKSFGDFALICFIVEFFMAISNLATNAYIIQKQEQVQDAINVAFSLQLILSSIVFALILIFGNPIMQIIGFPNLYIYLKLLSPVVLLLPLVNSLRSMMEKELNFFQSNYPAIIAIILQSILTIILAWMGKEIWALVIGLLAKTFVEIVLLLFVVPMFPIFKLKTNIVKDIFRFCFPLIISGTVVFFYWNIDYFMVGKMLNTTELGYYYFAFKFPHYLMAYSTAITTITLPMFSKFYDDLEILHNVFAVITRYTGYLMFFIVCLTNVLGREIIIFIFNEKWLPALIPFQLLMFLAAFRNTTVFWNPLLQSRGITRYLLVAAPFNLAGIVGLGLWWTEDYGILGMSLAVSVTMILSISFFVPIFTKTVLRHFSFWKELYRPFLLLFTVSLIGSCAKSVLFFINFGEFILFIVFLFVLYVSAFLFDRKKEWAGNLPDG